MKNPLLLLIIIPLASFMYFQTKSKVNTNFSKKNIPVTVKSTQLTSHPPVDTDKNKIIYQPKETGFSSTQSKETSANLNTPQNVEPKIITNEKPDIKIDSNLLKTETINPKSLPSLEQFRKDHPETKITIEKLNNGQMNPTSMPTLEQFRKEHPEVQVKVEKLDNGKMFPSN
jgi:hypothetical protein